MAERLVLDLLYNKKDSKYWAVEVLADESFNYTIRRHYTGDKNKVTSVDDYSSSDFYDIIDRYENKVLTKLHDKKFKLVKDGDEIGEPPRKLLELMGLAKVADLPVIQESNKKQLRKIRTK